MKKLYIMLLVVLVKGCTPRNCQSLDRSFQYSDRHYDVKQYSGGKLIGEYKFYGILNNEEHSDGYFFFKGDTLIEVSGDLTITSYK